MNERKWILQIFLQIKIVDEILNSKEINDIYDYLKPSAPVIIRVLWRIAIIFWIILFIPVIFVSWIAVLVSFWFYTLSALINILSILLQIYIGLWMIKFKKFVPTLSIVLFWLWSLNYLLGVLSSPFTIFSFIIGVFLSGCVLIFILKSEELFNDSTPIHPNIPNIDL